MVPPIEKFLNSPRRRTKVNRGDKGMSTDRRSDEFKSKVINLMHDHEEMARDRRLTDKRAATNCAQTALSLREWLNEMGLGPRTEPLS